MPKLPVFGTVGLAYGFVFRNLGTMYRLCWFPILVSTIPDIAPAESLASGWSPGLPALTFRLVIDVVVFLVQSFLTAMALVAIHRVILFGDRQPGRYFLFNVGRAEFYFTAVPAVLQFSIIVTGLVAFAVIRPPPFGQVAVSGGLVLVLFLGLSAVWLLGTWAICRLIAFYPLIVVRERLPFADAWHLSRGNFWRILGVVVCASLPIVVVMSAAGLFALPAVLSGTIPGEVAALPLISGVAGVLLGVVLGIPLLALGVAVLCYCFKALAGYAPDAIVHSTPEDSP
ncbi:MAG: hypothetical protein KDK07_11690 [Bauldia sp.]|nr:hypothetical protein [Bauldia sp.]